MTNYDETDWHELYEERAAIIEHDGKLSRMIAESLAQRHTDRLREQVERT